MADEDKNTEEKQVEEQTTEGTETADSTEEKVTTDAETKTTPEPSETERKLTEQFNELQGKFDTLSQDSTKDRQLLEELSPFVDWDGMKKGRVSGESDELSDEDEQTFLTKGEAKALEQRVDEKIKTSDFIRDFRTKFPDLADKGPKEEMVRYFFENKTHRADGFDKRLKDAVEAARSMFKSEQDKGVANTKADEDKLAQEQKVKDEAADKASGLSSAGITSPKTVKSEETETASDYVTSRKERLNKLKTL